MKLFTACLFLFFINTSYSQITTKLDGSFENIFIIGPDSVFAIVLPKNLGGDYKQKKNGNISIYWNLKSQVHLLYSVVPDSVHSKPIEYLSDIILKKVFPENTDLSGHYEKITSPITGLLSYRKQVPVINGKNEEVLMNVAAYYHPEAKYIAIVMSGVSIPFYYKMTTFMALNSFTWFPKPRVQQNGLSITMAQNLLIGARFLNEEIDFNNLGALSSGISDHSKPVIRISKSSKKIFLEDFYWNDLRKNSSIIRLSYNHVKNSYESVAYLNRIDEENKIYRLVIVSTSTSAKDSGLNCFFTVDMKFEKPVREGYNLGATDLFNNLRDIPGEENSARFLFYYTWMQYMAATLSI
jgi:hypothetical protein